MDLDVMKDLLQSIDLDRPELKTVNTNYREENYNQAMSQLFAEIVSRRKNGFLSNPQSVIQYLKNKKQPRIDKVANDLMKNIFIFDEAWDMEKCLDPVQFTDEIDWQYSHNDDEWTFMLNRHHYLIKLIQAYWGRGDKKYYDKCETLLLSWMSSESEAEGRENSSWRTIDTGIRLKNWVRIFEYLIFCPDFSEELFVNILVYIKKQIDYLMDSYSPTKALSNWRILEFHGVFIAASYFDFFKISSETIKKVIKILEESLQIQVTNDGFHWEQSFMYHHEVLICMLEVLLVAHKNGISIPDKIRHKVIKMAEATSHLVTPEGKQTCYGDSDIENVQGLLTLASIILKEKNLGNFVLTKADEELLLLYGLGLENDDLDVDRTPLEVTDFAHEDVGNYFVRTGWDKEASFMFFKNGFLGSGHGHSDLLHFDLIVRGKPVLVDSGRFTYSPNDYRRQKYKSLQSHNSIILDNQDIVEQNRSWGTNKVPNEIKRPCVINNEIILLQGMHLGYMDAGKIVNRKIIWIKPNIWLVVDQVFSNSEVSYTVDQNLHFNKPILQKSNTQFSYSENEVNVIFEPLDSQSVTIDSCNISPSYNSEYSSQFAQLKSTCTNDAVSRFLIVDSTDSEYFYKKVDMFDMNGIKVSEECGSAISITMQDTEWLIVLNYKEEDKSRKVYLVDGIPVYGRTVVIKKQEGEEVEKTVLEY